MKIDDGQIYYSPSDLANHLACAHLTDLERQYAAGEIELVYHSDPMLELLIELGETHEQAYLAHLKAIGRSVDDGTSGSQEEGLDRTDRLVKAGTEVIFQASLLDLPWRGRADFLLRVDEPSVLGNWSYEVADTKLAQETRATTVLQLCMYSEMIAKIQGVEPKYMHIVKPGSPFETESLRIADFAAYYRMAKQRFLQHVALPMDMDRLPEPCAKCETCNWWPRCNQIWRDGDHLIFVAAMPKSQIIDLREHGVNTLEAFAGLSSPHPAQPKRGSVESYGKSQRQARIQLKGRQSGKPEHEFNEVERAKGFCLLPEPNEGDVFFDIEGNPRAAGDGLEYLLGYVITDNGVSKFTGLWGLSKADEKKQFEAFVDLMLERWAKYPTMHIYHFAPYEPSALKRLALRHATREDELDRLLRSERFVDLYAVIRQGIRASVESYSIKQLEQFYGFERAEELESARKSLREVERLIELGLTQSLTSDHKNVVELYNKDDCLSTLALRDWLELLRGKLIETGAEIARPLEKSGDASESQDQISAETKEVFDALVADIENAPVGESQSARWLLAHTLDYFRRENKCKWWEYYRLRDLDYDDLLTERSAIAGLQFQHAFPLEGRAKIPVHRYGFPTQETTVRAGDTLYDGGEKSWGKVDAIDVDAGWIDVKKTATSIDRHATAAFAFNSLPLKPLPESLRFLGLELAASGTAKSARYDLLARKSPRLKSLAMPLEGSTEDVAVRLALDLDSSILPIQGPPGAGKTTVGSRMIAALSRAGKRVGVTAVSHKVILNLLEGVVEKSGPGALVRVAHQPGGGEIDNYPASVRKSGNKDESHSLLTEGYVVGGTAWLWASDQMDQQLDYLFIDEAGQMSLAMALAAGRAARNIVLLGDPQQLEQPQQGSHPEGSGVAALSRCSKVDRFKSLLLVRAVVPSRCT